MHLERIGVDAIVIPAGRRKPKQKKVDEIAASMATVGLIQPITVFATGGDEPDTLVAGGHRLAAAKKLGWDFIDGFVIKGDQASLRLVEIAENLHREDLTALERSKLLAEWVRLTQAMQKAEIKDASPPKRKPGRPKGAKNKSRQDAQVAHLDGNKKNKGGHTGDKGIAAASRELGVERTEAERALVIGKLSPGAQAAAIETGYDNNQTKLLAAAKLDTPEEQANYFYVEKKNRDERKATKKQKPSAAVLEAEDEAFADWLLEHAEPREIAQVVSWLEMKRNKQVVEIIRKRNAEND